MKRKCKSLKYPKCGEMITIRDNDPSLCETIFLTCPKCGTVYDVWREGKDTYIWDRSYNTGPYGE